MQFKQNLILNFHLEGSTWIICTKNLEKRNKLRNVTVQPYLTFRNISEDWVLNEKKNMVLIAIDRFVSCFGLTVGALLKMDHFLLSEERGGGFFVITLTFDIFKESFLSELFVQLCICTYCIYLCINGKKNRQNFEFKIEGRLIHKLV